MVSSVPGPSSGMMGTPAQLPPSMGQSTFMLEMNEVANILRNATQKSLIILDEIGRGTSTYDGLSIAWAVAEYISQNPDICAKTLFATHYHEMTQLEEQYENIVNYNVAVREKGEDIIFLRKIMKGAADRSYGIQVARLAGVPKAVTKRATVILNRIVSEKDKELDLKDRLGEISFLHEEDDEAKASSGEGAVYEKEFSVLNRIRSLKLDELTPLEAMNMLYELQKPLV